jgi:hypothetical protein
VVVAGWQWLWQGGSGCGSDHGRVTVGVAVWQWIG